MQVNCTSLQTDNHASTTSLSFIRTGWSSCQLPPNQQRQITKSSKDNRCKTVVWPDNVDRKCCTHVNAADVLVGRRQTSTALDTVEYGWTTLAAAVTRVSLATVAAVVGAIITACTMKTSPSLATMQPKMVHSCDASLLCVWRICITLTCCFTVTNGTRSPAVAERPHEHAVS